MKGVIFSHGYRTAQQRDEQYSLKSFDSDQMLNSKREDSFSKINRFAPENTLQKMVVDKNQLNTNKKEYAWYKGKIMLKQDAQLENQLEHYKLEQNLNQIISKGIINGTIIKCSQYQYDLYLIELWKEQKGDLSKLIKSFNDKDLHICKIWWNNYIMDYSQLQLIFKIENQIQKFKKYIQDLWDYEQDFFEDCQIMHQEFQKQKQSQKSSESEQIDYLKAEFKKRDIIRKKTMENIQKNQELQKIKNQLSTSNVLNLDQSQQHQSTEVNGENKIPSKKNTFLNKHQVNTNDILDGIIIETYQSNNFLEGEPNEDEQNYWMQARDTIIDDKYISNNNLQQQNQEYQIYILDEKNDNLDNQTDLSQKSKSSHDTSIILNNNNINDQQNKKKILNQMQNRTNNQNQKKQSYRKPKIQIPKTDQKFKFMENLTSNQKQQQSQQNQCQIF